MPAPRYGEVPGLGCRRQHRLTWVDIHAGRLHFYDPRSGQEEWVQVDPPLGCAAPAQGGNFIVGMRHGIGLLNPRTGQLSLLAAPEAHLPGNRFNDGKCGPDGRFLAGTMDNREVEASGALYSYSPNGALKTLLDRRAYFQRPGLASGCADAVLHRHPHLRASKPSIMTWKAAKSATRAWLCPSRRGWASLMA